MTGRGDRGAIPGKSEEISGGDGPKGFGGAIGSRGKRFHDRGKERFRFRSPHTNPEGGTADGISDEGSAAAPLRTGVRQPGNGMGIRNGLQGANPRGERSRRRISSQGAGFLRLRRTFGGNHTRGRAIPHELYSSGFPSDTMALKKPLSRRLRRDRFLVRDDGALPSRRAGGTGHSMAEVFVDGGMAFR